MQLQARPETLQRQTVTLSLQTRQAIALLSMSNLDLTAHAESIAHDNPFLEVIRPDPAPSFAPSATRGRPAEGEGVEALADPAGPSLYAHVLASAHALCPDRTQARIAFALCEAIEPTGWLIDDLGNIARRLEVSEPDVEACLLTLQQIEPAGLFARSLTECLALQARRAGCYDEAMAALLMHLPLVARREWERVAAQTGLARDILQQSFARLRGFDPKPGLAWDCATPDPVALPDLIVRRDSSGWHVELNQSTLPTIRVDAAAADEMLTQLAGDDISRRYIQKARSAARWLHRATEGRNRTVLRVAAETLRRQRACLDEGMRCLQPMTLRDVADALGLHQSTVSRITATAMITLPGGTMRLKSLFSTGIKSTSGQDVSAKVLQLRIQDLIAQEDPREPLSDAAITKRVSVSGVHLARRTVAKYRGQAGLPGAAARRRRYSAEPVPHQLTAQDRVNSEPAVST